MTDIQVQRTKYWCLTLMKSLLNFHMRQLKNDFFTEELKECIAPSDRLLIHKEDRLNKYYMMFAGLTVSKCTSGSCCGKPSMWKVEHFLWEPKNFSYSFKQY